MTWDWSGCVEEDIIEHLKVRIGMPIKKFDLRRFPFAEKNRNGQSTQLDWEIACRTSFVGYLWTWRTCIQFCIILDTYILFTYTRHADVDRINIHIYTIHMQFQIYPHGITCTYVDILQNTQRRTSLGVQANRTVAWSLKRELLTAMATCIDF